MIHQEKNWIVVSKPAGQSVHNEPGKDLISELEKRFRKKPLPVHRLDQDTSGLMIVAWTPEAALDLQQALQDEKTKKTYLAVVRGRLPGSSSEFQNWDWPLSDKSEGRKNPQGLLRDRKPCLTRWRVQIEAAYFTQIECEIQTGRQHQIRKHCSLAKHAIVGDHRYGDGKYNDMISERYQTTRLFLHSYKLMLSFRHKTFQWTAPVPSEFSSLTRV